LQLPANLLVSFPDYFRFIVDIGQIENFDNMLQILLSSIDHKSSSSMVRLSQLNSLHKMTGKAQYDEKMLFFYFEAKNII